MRHASDADRGGGRRRSSGGHSYPHAQSQQTRNAIAMRLDDLFGQVASLRSDIASVGVPGWGGGEGNSPPLPPAQHPQPHPACASPYEPRTPGASMGVAGGGGAQGDMFTPAVFASPRAWVGPGTASPPRASSDGSPACYRVPPPKVLDITITKSPLQERSATLATSLKETKEAACVTELAGDSVVVRDDDSPRRSRGGSPTPERAGSPVHRGLAGVDLHAQLSGLGVIPAPYHHPGGAGRGVNLDDLASDSEIEEETDRSSMSIPSKYQQIIHPEQIVSTETVEVQVGRNGRLGLSLTDNLTIVGLGEGCKRNQPCGMDRLLGWTITHVNGVPVQTVDDVASRVTPTTVLGLELREQTDFVPSPRLIPKKTFREKLLFLRLFNRPGGMKLRFPKLKLPGRGRGDDDDEEDEEAEEGEEVDEEYEGEEGEEDEEAEEEEA